MPKLSNFAMIRKICINLDRHRNRPERHIALRQRLAINRGQALGYPKPYAQTRQQQRVEDDRVRRAGSPF